jgi:hypothetical protein
MATLAFRLRPTMKQRTAAGVPETWTHYASVEDARAGAKLMYHNDRVLRVMAVTDSVGAFAEWIERCSLRNPSLARCATGSVDSELSY